MEDNTKLLEAVDAIRKSTTAKGRAYAGTGVEPKWLASEILEYCKTHGWDGTLAPLPGGQAWLVLTGHVVALVEGSRDAFSVHVDDQNPVRLKSVLAGTGFLALTGVGVVALPLAGFAVWRSHSRKAKVSSIVAFIDSRVAPYSAKPAAQSAVASVADRLRDLASLRNQGLITNEEYEAKKQDLMKAL
jgi:hypothetical protein